jgi:hypothetical protein
MSEAITDASETVTDEETRARRKTDQWARFAAESYAEIAVLQSGNDDPEHRAKVRRAHERALARGSDFI